MSIFFATPMYGGMCTAQFHQSSMALAEELTKAGVSYDWATPFNESLITRARNNLVAEFLASDKEVLMFIDADIAFSVEDVSKLWNLSCEGNGIVVGAYPMKIPGSTTSAWVNGKMVHLSDLGSVPVEVDFAGTGFFMVRRDALERMIDVYRGLEYEEKGTKYALFDTEIHDNIYLSEDYCFCRRYRAIGGKILLDPTIKLKHIGNYTFGE